MLPDESGTTDYFAQLGFSLEHRLLQVNGKPRYRWSLCYGERRVFSTNGKSNFSTLGELWLAWFCEQPVLERNYACALEIAEASLGWSADERFRMEAWLLAHRFGRNPTTEEVALDPVNAWPWTVMVANAPGSRLHTVGGPWARHPEPARLTAREVQTSELGDPGWRKRALRVGRFDLQCAALFAGSLQQLIDNVDEALLQERLPKAAIGSIEATAARRRL